MYTKKVIRMQNFLQDTYQPMFGEKETMKWFNMIPGILALGFVVFYASSSDSFVNLLYNLTEGTLIVSMTYGLFLLYAGRDFRTRYGKLTIAFILFMIVFTHVMRVMYLLDREAQTIELAYFFKPYLFPHTLKIAANTMFAGLGMCLFVWLFRQPRKTRLKITSTALTVLGIVSVLFYFYINRDIRDQQIYFNYEINSLADIQHYAKSNRKTIYLDFWHSGCRPCLEAFQHHPAFRPSLNGDVVDLMFVGVDRSLPGEKQKQRLLIEKYDLQGIHSFVSRLEFSQTLDEAGYDATLHGIKSFPHHMIIGPDGQVVEIKAGKPTKELAIRLNNLE